MITLSNNNYSVTESSEIFSRHRNRFLKNSLGGKGYYFVRIDGRTCLIHRLVAGAYLPNPRGLPCINHKDKNKQNNTVPNLEWCTYSENNHYRDDKLNPQDRFNKYINGGVELEVALYSLC